MFVRSFVRDVQQMCKRSISFIFNYIVVFEKCFFFRIVVIYSYIGLEQLHTAARLSRVDRDRQTRRDICVLSWTSMSNYAVRSMMCIRMHVRMYVRKYIHLCLLSPVVCLVHVFQIVTCLCLSCVPANIDKMPPLDFVVCIWNSNAIYTGIVKSIYGHKLHGMQTMLRPLCSK